jgi:hypothetical protein
LIFVSLFFNHSHIILRFPYSIISFLLFFPLLRSLHLPASKYIVLHSQNITFFNSILPLSSLHSIVPVDIQYIALTSLSLSISIPHKAYQYHPSLFNNYGRFKCQFMQINKNI